MNQWVRAAVLIVLLAATAGLFSKAAFSAEVPEDLSPVVQSSEVSEQSQVEAVDPLSTRHIGKTLLSLVIVCLLAVLILGFFGKKLSNRSCFQNAGAGSKHKMKVLERTVIDRQNQVVVLDTGRGKQLLVGSGPGGVSLLGELKEDGSVEPAKQE